MKKKDSIHVLLKDDVMEGLKQAVKSFKLAASQMQSNAVKISANRKKLDEICVRYEAKHLTETQSKKVA